MRKNPRKSPLTAATEASPGLRYSERAGEVPVFFLFHCTPAPGNPGPVGNRQPPSLALFGVGSACMHIRESLGVGRTLSTISLSDLAPLCRSDECHVRCHSKSEGEEKVTRLKSQNAIRKMYRIASEIDWYNENQKHLSFHRERCQDLKAIITKIFQEVRVSTL